jgi:hypothetical protein
MINSVNCQDIWITCDTARPPASGGKKAGGVGAQMIEALEAHSIISSRTLNTCILLTGEAPVIDISIFTESDRQERISV